ncbi:hypothetical protein FHS59_002587 [Algoriphagus iocasae]|uniref:DUF4099 domain-containing protein n=2 Tax=Algoriphagus TaxID=246875 RepID=A0A1I7A8N1_9BACT|nr:MULTISPECIES: DUF4099 domain-containing protein [Algoriphagus]MBB6326959.1 hypothetical protein [Algoriphagus iocasae]SFT71289.1 Protein of unknown function [Algoriphagus locisalis]
MKNQSALPMRDLEIFGIVKDGNFTIPEKEVHALKNGKMTDIVELKDLKGKEIQIDKLPARLSIVRGEDGNPSLRIDPVYREANPHPDLSESERNQLVKKKLANLKKSYVDKDGNIQSEIIEYDHRTKQFLSYNPRDITAHQEVNGEALSPQQKKKYKEGEVVALGDGTEFQLSPSAPKGIRSNNRGLVLSVLLDGGISYLLITGVQKMLGKESQEEKAYSKGYLQAVKQVQKQVERRISRNPNDKDAVRDLNNIKEEYSKISADDNLPKEVRDDFDINKIKRLNSIDTEEGRNPRKKSGEQDNDQERDI